MVPPISVLPPIAGPLCMAVPVTVALPLAIAPIMPLPAAFTSSVRLPSSAAIGPLPTTVTRLSSADGSTRRHHASADQYCPHGQTNLHRVIPHKIQDELRTLIGGPYPALILVMELGLNVNQKATCTHDT